MTALMEVPLDGRRGLQSFEATLHVRMPHSSLGEILLRLWTNALAIAIHEGHRDSPPRAGQDTPTGNRPATLAPGSPIAAEIHHHRNLERRAETERADLIRQDVRLRIDADLAADRGALDVRRQLMTEADHKRLLAGFAHARAVEQRRLIARKTTELTEVRHGLRRPTDGPYRLHLPRLLIEAADAPRGTIGYGHEELPQAARVSLTDDEWNELTTWCLRRNDDGPERRPTLERAIYRLDDGRLKPLEPAFTVGVFRRIVARACGGPSQDA